MFSVQRFFSPPKRWPCQHINPKLFSRSSFAGRAVILEPLLGKRVFVALSWFWAADLQKLVVFYVFQIARATLCGLWAGRPLKTRGRLRGGGHDSRFARVFVVLQSRDSGLVGDARARPPRRKSAECSELPGARRESRDV